MKIIVNPHDLTIEEKSIVNEGEYNITQLNFEFSKEYTDDLVKKAIFIGDDGKAYEMLINDNKCMIPSEILLKKQLVTIGVYAYKITGSELTLRYSPSPIIYQITDGSYRADSVPSEEITPSQFEQYQQALQNGLAEVNAKLQEVIDTSETLEENGTYAKEQGDYAKETTDELVSKVENGDFNGATFTPSVSNDGDLSWSNDKGLDNPTTVNIKGQKGDTGEPFTISKTYPSVEAMEADFDNMEVGDYVMIASSVDDEDNAKLYVKTDTEWVFITDFSGAIGIQGEPGVGIVSASAGNSSESDGYTITPITFKKTDNSQTTVNVSVKNGEQGPQGEQGIQGDTGVGISTVTAGTPIIDEEKTTTPITFGKTDGTSETVNVEAQNGETQDLSGYVTNDALDNIVPKNIGNGELVSVDDALAYKTFEVKVDGASEQVVTTGANLFENKYESQTKNGITLTKNKDGTITLNGICSGSETYNDFNLIDLFSYSGEKTASVEVISGSATGLVEWQLTDNNWGNTLFMGIQNNANPNSQQFTDGITYTRSTLRIANNCACNNLTFGLQIQNGTEVKPYEPYTGGQPSPSPDYPQEITTLTFDKITRCGKNIFDYDKFLNDIGDSLTIEGTNNNFTYRSNNSIGSTLGMFKFNFKEKKSYSFSGKISSSSANGAMKVIYTDGTSIYIYSKWDGTSLSQEFFKTTDGTKTIKQIELSSYGNGTVFELTDFMISEGSQATDYEPYQATEYIIDLQGNEMVELRNGVKDELVIDKYGNVSLIKNVGKYFFDGSENWVSSPTTDTYWEFSITYETGQQANYTYSLSNYFSDKDYNRLICTKLEVYIRFPKNIGIDVSDVEKFKSWLQSHNTIAYYELTEPQTIPLGTLSELITTLNGTNNISINGNIPTSISATYALDIKKYIDNKLAEISAAIIEEG